MSSKDFTSIGRNKILPYLRGDVRGATKSLVVIGPWIDDYFAEQLVLIAPKTLNTRVLIRPQSQVESYVWERMNSALTIFAAHWLQFEARTLQGLHAKSICIDDHLVFTGSANWYRFSLEESSEIVIRGPIDSISGFRQEVESLWLQAKALTVGGAVAPITRPTTGITHEVLDPIAARALSDNPKAFRLGRKLRQ